MTLGMSRICLQVTELISNLQYLLLNFEFLEGL